MSEEYGPNFVTLTDEEGNDIELEYIDALEHNGTTYMAFFPVVEEGEEENEDEYGLIILKSETVDGEEMLANVVDEDEMRRQGMTLTELMEQMRECGVANLSDVGCAVLEISGKVNVFPLSEKRAVTPGDLNLRPGYENLPLPLVLDGKVQEDSLRAARRSAKWLQSELSRFSVDVPGTYLCLLGTDGVLCVQKKGEGRLHFARSLQPGQVNW